MSLVVYAGGKALTQVLKVLLRVGVSSAFGVLKVELSSRKYYSE